MPQGTIRKITEKGFGFIEGEGGDIFFHLSSLQNGSFETLQIGQRVEYEDEDGPKGKRAVTVVVL